MGFLIGGLIVLASVAAGLAVRFLRRDEVFDGPTPGLLPAPGQPAVRRFLRRSEQPPIAVRFNPPDGIGPGLAGVAIDGRVDPVELSATLIDLGQRGWLTLRPLTRPGAAKPYDWEIAAHSPQPQEPLSGTEQALLMAAFNQAPVTTLSAFRSQPGVREASRALLGEAAERHWLRTFTPAGGWSVGLVGPATVMLGIAGFVLFGLGFIGIGVAAGGAVFFALTRRMPEPLSAEGFAARVQCEGFKQYLATAEAEQLRFEVGIDTFSRYLPFAMVFGVVDHWRSVFADALQADPGVQLDALDWLILGDALHSIAILDLISPDSGMFDSLITDFGDFTALSGLDGVTDAFGSGFDGFDGFDGFGDIGGD